MKRKALAGAGIAALAALAGCGIKFSGMLDVHEPITITQKGAANCNQQWNWWDCKPDKTVTLTPGQFPARVTLGMANLEKSIKLEVDNAKPATSVEIAFSKDINIGGHFLLTAAQTGQNFDLGGDIVTNVTDSPEEEGTESCSFDEEELVCDDKPQARTGGPSVEAARTEVRKLLADGRLPDTDGIQAPRPVLAGGAVEGSRRYYHDVPPGCHTVLVSHPGEMFVRYYYETTDRDIKASFLQGGKSLADYTGHASDTRKIYTYKGECRPEHYHPWH